MPKKMKKEKGIDNYMPEGWDDWTQKEREEWLSYPTKPSKKKKKESGSYAWVGPKGMKPAGY